MSNFKYLLLLLLAFNVCWSTPITHTVFFTLHHEAGSPEALSFHREAMKLASLPTVQDFQWVKETSAKNDFDYGLTMVFEDSEAYHAYNIHPLHTRFVEEVWLPNVADFMEIDWQADSWKPLLDKNLSQWEIWTGVPHEDLGFIPEGVADDVELSSNGISGKPVGLGDPYEIFEVSEEDGEWVMYISGKVYAGLTTLESFSDYHMTLEYKWGEAKWAPRANDKRDSGLLYHCYGRHGAFWNVWKASLEVQVQETDTGDLHQLAGPKSYTTMNADGFWDPAAKPALHSGRVKRSENHESAHDEWTRVDLYVIGDRAIHVVNGKVVMALEGAVDGSGNPLTSGQIQLQSEGAEVFYRDVRIRPISAFPESLAKTAFPE